MLNQQTVKNIVQKIISACVERVSRLWIGSDLVYCGKATEPPKAVGVPVPVMSYGYDREVYYGESSAKDAELLLKSVLNDFGGAFKDSSIRVTVIYTDEIWDLLDTEKTDYWKRLKEKGVDEVQVFVPYERFANIPYKFIRFTKPSPKEGI